MEHKTIDELLRNYSFVELNPRDRAWVLQQLTEEEYTWRRKILLRAEKAMRQDSPPFKAQGLDVLLGQVSIRQASKAKESFFFRKIPIWQAGTAIVALAAGFFCFPYFQNGDIGNGDNPSAFYKTDTVYRDRIVEKIVPGRVQYVDRVIYVDDPQKKSINIQEAPNPRLVSLKEDSIPSRSQVRVKEEELMDLLVEIH